MNNTRQSNLELLRIITMIMIISYHIILYCLNPQLTESGLINEWDNGWFNNPVFYKRLLIPQSILPLGKTGVLLFILLSGYFLVERGNRVNVKTQAIKLMGQVGFATLLLVSVSALYYRYIGNYVPVLNIRLFNETWWFAGFYFIVILVGAIKLNDFLNRLSKEQYQAFLAACMAVISFSWSGGFLENVASGFRVIMAGILSYAGGGYIKKYNPLRRVRVSVIILVIICCYLLMWFAYYSASMSSIKTYLQGDKSSAYTQVVLTNAYSEYYVVTILLSVSIFELFRRLRMKPSRIINGIASATFMIYLIHENELMRNFWKHRVDLVTFLYRTPLKFCLAIALRVLSVLAMGLAAYGAYRAMLWVLHKLKPLFLKPED